MQIWWCKDFNAFGMAMDAQIRDGKGNRKELLENGEKYADSGSVVEG
jgi:hypothetical protein